ncbi:MAG: hypothetical protein DMG65_19205 [Candidatus Angelobacter sp. Gp1-AA117]|nr:MAG: hypothetical protein DMG65_19205 [Candidatus Angelobacter sp. Gp1-AA117]
MTMRPIFISYRRSWKAEVEKLAECLQLHGLRVFLDYSDGSELIGASYNDELRRIIEEQSEGMLLYITKGIAESSAIWNLEVPAALQHGDREQDFFIVPFFREISPAALAQMARHGARLAACNGISAMPANGVNLNSFLAEKYTETAVFILKKMLRNKTGAITLGLQTRLVSPVAADTDLFLGWCSIYPDERPLASGCLAAHRALKNLSGVLSKAATRRIQVQAKGHLSAGVALGAAFSRTTGFELEIEQNGQVWSSQGALEPFDLRIISNRLDANLSDICMTIAISRSETVASVDRAQEVLGIPRGGRIVIEPEVGSSRQSIPSGGCARSIAGQAASALMKARAQWGLRKTHLFISAPFALAVLIGHELNALGPIDVYEHVKTTDEYVKAFTL